MRRSLDTSLCLIGLILGVVGCRQGGGDSATPVPGDAPVPVAVAVAEQRDVPVQLPAIGTVEPYQVVSVRSQVQGELTEIRFNEGQFVKSGDVLFTIDPRPYEVALRLTQATLAKDAALAKDAQAEAARMAGLFGSEAAAQRESERASAQADAAQAQVDADRANVEHARLNLEYCTIRAPFDAYIGSLLVHKGAILKARETDLVALNQVNPIYVTFSVPEQRLGEIRANHAIKPLEVEAIPPDNDTSPERGLLTFIDNEVDRTTGTIRLRGTFQNEDHRLWPGQFVNAMLRLSLRVGAVVVPSQAVQTSQAGQFIFVAGDDGTAEMRTVKPGYEIAGWTVIEDGVKPGEIVVTDGQLRLVAGSKVQPKNQAATAPASRASRVFSVNGGAFCSVGPEFTRRGGWPTGTGVDDLSRFPSPTGGRRYVSNTSRLSLGPVSDNLPATTTGAAR